MARLAVKPLAGAQSVLRYEFDRDGLIRWFGGAQRLVELCAIYGVPWPQASSKAKAPQWHVSAPILAVMLELAERMHKPLDLYQFVVQVRSCP